MLWCLSEVNRVTYKPKGVTFSKYDNVLRHNPEIFKAVVDTLKRKAWNE